MATGSGQQLLRKGARYSARHARTEPEGDPDTARDGADIGAEVRADRGVDFGSRAAVDVSAGTERPKRQRALLETLTRAGLIVVCSLIFGLLLRTFVAQLYTVPSSSMENTLKISDSIVVSRLAPRLQELHHGDIIVFRDPGGWLPEEAHRKDSILSPIGSALVFTGLIPEDSGKHLVKRVIALPGESVECDDQGTLKVNKERVAEPYLYPGDRSCGSPFQVKVPPGSIWVMGDHRSVSADSRFHRDNNNGAVPIRKVIGRVVATLAGGRLRLL